MKYGLLIGFVCWLAPFVRADHIIGGDITLRATGAPDSYKLAVHLFVDRTHLSAKQPDAFLACHIYRTSDNVRIQTVNTFLSDTKNLYESDNICARQVKLQLAMWTYDREVSLPVGSYNDPAGYYVIFQRCCRNPALTNVVNPAQTGSAFRLDFKLPTTSNSSPEFVLPEARYVCINDPFTMAFAAKDPDGDILRYELINPLKGHTTQAAPVDYLGASYATYPPIQWTSGSSALNAIPGLQPLRVDPSSGLLTVTAQGVGLYVFSVMVTESRNGVDIGQVRREYQLPVVDCKKNTTPPPPITFQGKSTTLVERCDETPVTLSTVDAGDFKLQWQLNGAAIAGATSTTLLVKDAGVYTVKKQFPYNCGVEATSLQVRVLPAAPPRAKIVADRTQLTFEGDEIGLGSAPQPDSYRFRWSMDGAQTGSSTSLLVGQPGTYTLRVSTSDDRCASTDTIRVTRFIRLLMPNAFTPNGDGVNDTWEIRNLNSLSDAEVFVFSRNGALVYYADKQGRPWDGTYEQQKVQPGEYRYLIRAPGRPPLEGSLQVIY